MKISAGMAGTNNAAAIIFRCFVFQIDDKQDIYRLKYYDKSISIDELFNSNSNTFHLNVQNIRKSFKSATIIGKELSKFKTTK